MEASRGSETGQMTSKETDVKIKTMWSQPQFPLQKQAGEWSYFLFTSAVLQRKKMPGSRGNAVTVTIMVRTMKEC